ncbi:borealin [Entelurus aequoreus]|uniref:borealin n=1 Tax=Entelurus aequoreus TaxID=161455 RepID=UPI002B1E524F|nr:borealin [Entelurus aequoreus]
MAPSKKPRKQNTVKNAKLEVFLEDFDSEVKTILDQMQEKERQLLKDMDNHYNMTIINLPKAVRQINWLEIFKTEKAKSPPVDEAKREAMAAIVENVVAEDHAAKTPARRIKKKKGAAKDEENSPRILRKGKTTRKPPTTSKRAKAVSICQQNGAIKRSSTLALVTPARTPFDASLLMGSTPLITPRFDPRLPMTSAVRIPRHKERIYSISVNGSPIAANSQEVVINVPRGNGEMMPLLASQMDSLDLSTLDETAMKSIRHLVTRVTSLSQAFN